MGLTQSKVNEGVSQAAIDSRVRALFTNTNAPVFNDDMSFGTLGLYDQEPSLVGGRYEKYNLANIMAQVQNGGGIIDSDTDTEINDSRYNDLSLTTEFRAYNNGLTSEASIANTHSDIGPLFKHIGGMNIDMKSINQMIDKFRVEAGQLGGGENNDVSPVNDLTPSSNTGTSDQNKTLTSSSQTSDDSDNSDNSDNSEINKTSSAQVKTVTDSATSSQAPSSTQASTSDSGIAPFSSDTSDVSFRHPRGSNRFK